MQNDKVALSERWLILGGLPMLYRDAAETAPAGATPIVHVHGFGISGRYLVPTAERLAPFYPTYVPDLPGYGRSHKPKRTLSIPESADALVAFLDEVGVERAVLLGNSMGCLITLNSPMRIPSALNERSWFHRPVAPTTSQSTAVCRNSAAIVASRRRECFRWQFRITLRFGLFSSFRLFHAMTHYPTVERVLELDLPILSSSGSVILWLKGADRELVEQKPNLTLVLHD